MGDVIWTTTEIYVGVISACLPTIRPLLVQGNHAFSRLTSKLSNSRTSSSSPPSSKRHGWPSTSVKSSTGRLSGQEPSRSRSEVVFSKQDAWSHATVGHYQATRNDIATDIRRDNSQKSESEFPLQGIRVERAVESSWSLKR